MSEVEAERIAHAVVAMVIQDSDAYDLIERWAKTEAEIDQLHQALTKLRDDIEQRAGMVEESKPETTTDFPRSTSLFDGEAVTESESK